MLRVPRPGHLGRNGVVAAGCRQYRAAPKALRHTLVGASATPCWPTSSNGGQIRPSRHGRKIGLHPILRRCNPIWLAFVIPLAHVALLAPSPLRKSALAVGSPVIRCHPCAAAGPRMTEATGERPPFEAMEHGAWVTGIRTRWRIWRVS